MNDQRKRQAEAHAQKHALGRPKDYYLPGNAPVTLQRVNPTKLKSYLQGWSDADATPMPDAGDEGAAKDYANRFGPQSASSVAVVGQDREHAFLAGIAHARRTQAAEIERLKGLLSDASAYVENEIDNFSEEGIVAAQFHAEIQSILNPKEK